MMKNPRVLGVVRLSVERDDTTSPERQREHVQHWADGPAVMGTVIGWAEDLDVSGGMSPFKRPQLGPWLTKRVDSFDVIAVWKLDRLTRRSQHFAELVDWCEDHGKVIVSTTEGFDLSTPMGKMFARIIAAFAEGELDTIKARVTDSSRKLREMGAWFGGVLPFGYQFADREEGGKKLVQDPEYAALLRRLRQRVMDGATLYGLQRELNEAEIPTWRDHLRDGAGRSTRDTKWSQKAIQQALCNPRTAGYLLHNGEIVEGDDGEPVFITDEPIFTQQEWAEVTAKLTVRKGGPRAQRRPSLLGGIARCGHDKTPLGSRRNVTKRDYKDEPDVYYKYMCRLAYSGAKDECGVFLQQAELDSIVEDWLLEHLGDLEVMEPASSAVSTLRSELDSVSARLARLEADYAAGKYDGEGQEDSYFRIHGLVSAKLSKLRASFSESHDKYVATGRTYRQVWESKTIEEKRSFLIDHAVEVRVWKNLVPWAKFSIKVDYGDIGGMARAAGLDGVEADWIVIDYYMPTELMLLRVADADRVNLSRINRNASSAGGIGRNEDGSLSFSVYDADGKHIGYSNEHPILGKDFQGYREP